MLAFRSVCMDSCACACFLVFVSALVLGLVLLPGSVCVGSCTCACVSQCLYDQ